MKLFDKGQSDADRAVAEVLRLRDERHALLVRKLKSIDEGDGTAAVEADGQLRDNKIRISAAEHALKIAVGKDLSSKSGELPALKERYSSALVSVTQRGLMHCELAARALECVGRGDIATRLREAVEPVWALAQITVDPLSRDRAPGKKLVDEFLSADPLPDLQAMRQQIQTLEGAAAADAYVLESAWKRAINSALQKAIGPEELRKRHELERRASARA